MQIRQQVVASIFGGLGNQMFQYAAGRALAHRLGVPLTLDLTWFEARQPNTAREYGLVHFPILAGKASKSDVRELKGNDPTLLSKILYRLLRSQPPGPPTLTREPHFHYWPEFERLRSPILLYGYWQSPRYFDDIAYLIRSEFVFQPLPVGQSQEVADQISRDDNSVAVHIRRGDYFSNAANYRVLGGCCPPTYYARGLELLSAEGQPLKLFLFSDEPDWARTNFDPGGHSVVVVDIPAHRETPHHDMHLMSLAKHYLIANSSFSWWAAWLRSKSEEAGHRTEAMVSARSAAEIRYVRSLSRPLDSNLTSVVMRDVYRTARLVFAQPLVFHIDVNIQHHQSGLDFRRPQHFSILRSRQMGCSQFHGAFQLSRCARSICCRKQYFRSFLRRLDRTVKSS